MKFAIIRQSLTLLVLSIRLPITVENNIGGMKMAALINPYNKAGESVFINVVI